QRFASGQQRFDFRPHFLLTGVREQILHDGAALGGFFDIEERVARLPAIADRVVPGLAALALTDDDLHAIVAHVERLSAALHPVTHHGNGFIAQNLTYLLRRIVAPLHGRFHKVADANLAHDRSRLVMSFGADVIRIWLVPRACGACTDVGAG